MKTYEKQIYKTTLVGSLVNIILVAAKLITGILGHSNAMIADAIHSLSDLITDVIVIVFVKIANKPIDKNHAYGHGKYETLAVTIIGCILLFVAAGILWDSTLNIIKSIKIGPLKSPGIIALWAAVASIVFKEILYRYTLRNGKKYNSKAVIANAWHHRSDALSSVGTTLGIAGAIFLGGKWSILDPIAAVIVSLFIAKAAIGLLKPSIEELLEKSLPEEIENNILKITSSIDGVHQPHNLRTRRIGNNIAIELHIRMDGELSLEYSHSTTNLIEAKFREQYGVNTHINIHVEPIPKQLT